MKYFDETNDDFDFATFDIYAEIGPSAKLVARVCEKLLSRSSSIGQSRSENILLSGKIHPSIMAHAEKLRRIQNELNKLSRDVREGSGKRAEKQKLLDIADRAHREAAERSLRVSILDRKKPKSDTTDVGGEDELLLSIGTYLLGSGAEFLDASVKRNLGEGLIVVGGDIVARRTEQLLNVDFVDIKEHILADDVIMKFIDSTENAGTSGGKSGESNQRIEEVRKFLDAFLDLVEFALLSLPLREIMRFLCEHAQNRVLATSLDRINVDRKFERVLRAIWLSDVDPKAGYPAILSAIKELPPAPFFRVNLASHLLLRAYWNHWKLEDRLSLLDAAAEVLRETTLALSNKGEIKRKIEEKSEKRAK